MSRASDDQTKHQRLGDDLRDAREYLGLSQDAVGRALGVPRSTISAIEAGKRKVSFVELEKLAALYRRSVESFSTETESATHDEDPVPRALFRATRRLSPEDREQVLRFAEFLRLDGQERRPEGG